MTWLVKSGFALFHFFVPGRSDGALSRWMYALGSSAPTRRGATTSIMTTAARFVRVERGQRTNKNKKKNADTVTPYLPLPCGLRKKRENLLRPLTKDTVFWYSQHREEEGKKLSTSSPPPLIFGGQPRNCAASVARVYRGRHRAAMSKGREDCLPRKTQDVSAIVDACNVPRGTLASPKQRLPFPWCRAKRRGLLPW